MKTCYKCGRRMWPTQTKTPTGPHDGFEVRWDCANGHSGTESGQTGTPESEWAKTGEVWGPSVRVDSPEGEE